ncbi:MAG: hypothetical protein LBF66_03200 [Holosporales bacterium]|jgi:hypothetical protein|nr:hypothetical protein [Holosporales bacterium]
MVPLASACLAIDDATTHVSTSAIVDLMVRRRHIVVLPPDSGTGPTQTESISFMQYIYRTLNAIAYNPVGQLLLCELYLALRRFDRVITIEKVDNVNECRCNISTRSCTGLDVDNKRIFIQVCTVQTDALHNGYGVKTNVGNPHPNNALITRYTAGCDSILFHELNHALIVARANTNAREQTDDDIANRLMNEFPICDIDKGSLNTSIVALYGYTYFPCIDIMEAGKEHIVQIPKMEEYQLIGLTKDSEGNTFRTQICEATYAMAKDAILLKSPKITIRYPYDLHVAGQSTRSKRVIFRNIRDRHDLVDFLSSQYSNLSHRCQVIVSRIKGYMRKLGANQRLEFPRFVESKEIRSLMARAVAGEQLSQDDISTLDALLMSDPASGERDENLRERCLRESPNPWAFTAAEERGILERVLLDLASATKRGGWRRIS